MRILSAKNDKQIIIDEEDVALVTKYSWYVETNGYARSHIEGSKISMHRFILGLKKGQKIDVDHINGNRADNRKKNLRLCTRAQNLSNQFLKPSNTSGFKGVSWDVRKKKWQAKINMNGKQFHLGRYETKEDAHKAYCEAADRMKGEFANHGIRISNPNEEMK